MLPLQVLSFTPRACAKFFTSRNFSARPQLLSLFVLGLTIAFSVSPAFAARVRSPQNKIGTATLTEHACNATGMANGTCYRAVVSGCAETTGEFAATVKVNQPPSSVTSGTVFFTTGGTGDALYDYDPDYIGDSRCTESNCGLMAVQSINAAGYRTVDQLPRPELLTL